MGHVFGAVLYSLRSHMSKKTVPGACPPVRAFSLMELLVVIALLSLLAALLLPALVRSKGAAQSAACKSNLRQLGIGLHNFVSEHRHYPENRFRTRPYSVEDTSDDALSRWNRDHLPHRDRL